MSNIDLFVCLGSSVGLFVLFMSYFCLEALAFGLFWTLVSEQFSLMGFIWCTAFPVHAPLLPGEFLFVGSFLDWDLVGRILTCLISWAAPNNLDCWLIWGLVFIFLLGFHNQGLSNDWIHYYPNLYPFWCSYIPGSLLSGWLCWLLFSGSEIGWLYCLFFFWLLVC